jgi:hypothetical protein
MRIDPLRVGTRSSCPFPGDLKKYVGVLLVYPGQLDPEAAAFPRF